MSKKYSVLGSVVLAATLLLVGCGGGDSVTPTSSTSTLSGTAAGGVAIIGTVLVTDSLGASKGGTIDSTGHYNVDVSGMTGPFALKAYGKVGNTTVTYYSAATSADVGGTINITPFTDLILSNLLGQIASNYFANPANKPTGGLITSAALAAQETALQAKLAPIFAQLGIDSAIDLLRTTFTANHTGLDAVMDLVKVDIDPVTQIATIKNAITQAVMSTDDVTSKSDDSTAVTAGTFTDLTTTAVTDLQAITATMNGFAKLFANGTPSVATMTTSGYFDTTSAFLDGGMSFDQFATELSTDQLLVGVTFSNIDILFILPTEATVTLQANFKDGTAEMFSMKMIKVGAAWKIQGDGLIAENDTAAQAVYTPSNTSQPIQNGLKFYINPFNYNTTHSSAMVASATITGPGLPTNGVNMVVDPHMEGMVLQSTATSGSVNNIPECTNGQTTECVDLTKVTDNSVYTIVLKGVSSNTIQSYTRIIGKAPVATSTLSAASFPAITSVTLNGVALTSANYSGLVPGANLTFTWSLPASLGSDYMSAFAYTDLAEYFKLQKDFLATDTRATFTLGSGDITATGLVTGTGIWLSARDVFNRQFVYSHWQ